MFGSHLSIAGGMVNALHEAARLGLDTVQVFTKNQRQWKPPAPDPEADGAWLAELANLGWTDRTVSHNSYLINLSSPDDALRDKSLVLMRDEIARCERLSIPFLVLHPGAHTGAGTEAGLERIAGAIAQLLRESPAGRTTLCLETTVGAGSQLGGTFEELADLRARIRAEAGPCADGPVGDRVGFCLDTCHVLAGGYDVTTEEKALGVLAHFDRVCGLARLRVLHLNDSKGALGSHRDLHEHIGRGCVGLGCFAAVVNHPALLSVPKIMETPKGESAGGTPFDTLNLRRLKKLVRSSDVTRAPRPAGRPRSATRTAARAAPKTARTTR